MLNVWLLNCSENNAILKMLFYKTCTYFSALLLDRCKKKSIWQSDKTDNKMQIHRNKW